MVIVLTRGCKSAFVGGFCTRSWSPAGLALDGGGCEFGPGLFYDSGWVVDGRGFGRLVICSLILGEFKLDGGSIEFGIAFGVGDL